MGAAEPVQLMAGWPRKSQNLTVWSCYHAVQEWRRQRQWRLVSARCGTWRPLPPRCA